MDEKTGLVSTGIGAWAIGLARSGVAGDVSFILYPLVPRTIQICRNVLCHRQISVGASGVARSVRLAGVNVSVLAEYSRSCSTLKPNTRGRCRWLAIAKEDFGKYLFEIGLAKCAWHECVPIRIRHIDIDITHYKSIDSLMGPEKMEC